MNTSVPRILTAARVHLIAPVFWLAVPWLVLTASLLVSVLASIVINDADLDQYGTGGLVLFYFAFGAVYVQAITSRLPFAMGLSMAGGTFYIGTALFAAVQSLAYGVVFYLLLLLERATGGWGVAQPFFNGGWFTPAYSWTVDNPASQVAIFAAPMFALALLGMLIGVLYRRFGSLAVYAFVIVSIIAVGGAVTGLILWLKDDFLGYFFVVSPVTIFAGWPLILAVLLGCAGYLCSRRVVP